MGKAVKKIATVAAIGAAAFYGGSALATALKGGALGGAYTTSLGTVAGAIHTGAGVATSAGVGAGLFGAGAIQKAGLALQGVSYMQQRKYASAQASASKQAAEEQRRINQAQEKFRLVQERRQRLDLLRQQRIQTAQIETEAGSGGMGLTGTSGVLGSTSAIQTQATANIAALDQSSGASTALSRMSQNVADYQSRANLASARGQQYQQLSTLGSTLYKKGPEIFDMTKSIFKIG